MYRFQNRRIPRRSFLRGAGVALALPLLDAMRPAIGGEPGPETVPRRLFCVCTNMGIMPRFFWPEGTGRDYQASEYLKLIETHRRDFTIFSGVSHPGVEGGHKTELCYLTGAPHPTSSRFRNTVSLDQYAAKRIGGQTRFPCLSLVVGAEQNSLSWTDTGVKVPAESRPSDVFRRLFIRGSQAEVAGQVQQLRDGRSVLDVVARRAERLQRSCGVYDREKLDQYFTCVRDLERRMVQAEEWEQRPRPRVDEPPPDDIPDRTALIERTRLMYQLARLALATDSTRVIALMIDQNANPTVDLPGVSQGHHSLTHHGYRGGAISQLRIIESAQMQALGGLLSDLKAVQEDGGTLLDRTMVLYGSNLGNANSHDNRNLPLLLAGGGFRHGQHLAFDRNNNTPLSNLYVSLLQRLGVETDRFSTSTGTMRGLEAA